MTDWVSSGGVKIERAKQHIADLEGQTKAFFQVAPYTLIGEYEPKSRDTVYRWRPVPAAREIPPIWGAIAGDVIHNLRSSLDVLWRRATIPREGKTDRRKGAYFPFPNAAEELETRLAGVHEPAVKAALKIVKEFKPYPTGNEYLWLLNEASVADKHEVPIVVEATLREAGFSVSGLALGSATTHFSLEQVVWAKRVVLVEDGTEFARTVWGQRLELDQNSQPTFGIAFGEGGPLHGKSVLFTLHEFARITHAIAEAFIRDKLVR